MTTRSEAQLHSTRLRRRTSRGATVAEYALLIFGVLLIGAGAVKILGGAVKGRAHDAGETVVVGSGGGAVGGHASAPGDAPGAGGGTSSGGPASKMSASGKMSVGGPGTSGGRAASETPAADPGLDSVALRRWFAIALLAMGACAIGYVVLGARRAKLASDAIDGGRRSGGRTGGGPPRGPSA